KFILRSSGFGARFAEYVRGPLGWGNTKVGVIWVDDSSNAQYYQGFQAMASELGLNVVDVEKVAGSQSSYLPELSRLKDKGTETLVMVSGLDSLTMFRDLRAMLWRPNITGMFAADEVS